MGTREYFPTSKATERATKREQTRRLFNIPPLMSQPELRYSLDTEVFILVPRHYSSICKATFLVSGSGKNHRTTLSAFSEAENTGCFSERGKLHAGKLSWKLKSSMVFLSLEVRM